jgi:hypothetical protein
MAGVHPAVSFSKAWLRLKDMKKSLYKKLS